MKMKILLSPNNSDVNLFYWYILLSPGNSDVDVYFFDWYTSLSPGDSDVNVYFFYWYILLSPGDSDVVKMKYTTFIGILLYLVASELFIFEFKFINKKIMLLIYLWFRLFISVY